LTDFSNRGIAVGKIFGLSDVCNCDHGNVLAKESDSVGSGSFRVRFQIRMSHPSLLARVISFLAILYLNIERLDVRKRLEILNAQLDLRNLLVSQTILERFKIAIC
jgi:hypothetical protein